MGKYDDKLNLVILEPLKLGIEKPWTLDAYRKIGGYEVWEKILSEKLSRDQIIDHYMEIGRASCRERV